MPRALSPSHSSSDARRPSRLTAWALLLGACLWLPPGAALAAGDDSPLEVRVLVGTSAGTGVGVGGGTSVGTGAGAPARTAPATPQVTSGALDQSFTATRPHTAIRQLPGVHWVRLQAVRGIAASALPVLVVGSARSLRVTLYPRAGGSPTPLVQAASLPEFGATREAAFFVAGNGLQAGQIFYARIEADAAGADPVYFKAGSLEQVLARQTRHALMIALACGALAALALATAAMWLVLKDQLFLLYAGMTGLQALYLAYFSGQAFRWPLLAAGSAWVPYAWNVPVALSGTMASLFAREIADLRHAFPRVYSAFGWMAAAFAVLAVANVGIAVGLGSFVVAIGNLMFLGAGVFVLVVAFLAWRRGNRAAGWFLFAWILLETFAIVTSARLLVTRAVSSEALFYYGLPGSMVASAILTSLGVADSLRQQRHALTDAERRAKTDPLTGVLNRRSLLEQLEAVCHDARTNHLPVAVLFLDLDFFKAINDSYGHATGDACLAAIIPPIEAELRQSDIIGRYGGEEFVVVLNGADATAAQLIAERIRQRISEERIEAHGAPIQLTCSIGVASSEPLGVWGEALIAQADTAVYAAKRLGRNRVQVAIALAA